MVSGTSCGSGFRDNDNDDNDITDNDNSVRTINQQRRNVFSKIPRVGRSRWSSYDQDIANNSF